MSVDALYKVHEQNSAYCDIGGVWPIRADRHRRTVSTVKSLDKFENARIELVASICAEIKVLEAMAQEASDIDIFSGPNISTSDLVDELELSKLRRDSSSWSFTTLAAANL